MTRLVQRVCALGAWFNPYKTCRSQPQRFARAARRPFKITMTSATSCTNTALPVLECIDFVSDVGGVDQAPQYVVVEVAEAEGYAA